MTIHDTLDVSVVNIANLPVSGVIVNPSTNVDLVSSIYINQTTTGCALSLPNPTITTRGKRVTVYNTGTATFQMYFINISPQTCKEFEFTGSWNPVSDNTVGWKDVRTTNLQPQEYNGGIYWEFKQSNSIGLTTNFPTVSTYTGLQTFRRYSVGTDLSGGVVRQEAETDSGNKYYRLSVNATTWSAWQVLANNYYNTLQKTITGGGTVSFQNGNLSWNERFIAISGGYGGNTSLSGHYDIVFPPVGTVITGYGGLANQTVVATGIPLGLWNALYYEIPSANNATINTNFKLVNFSTSFTVPDNWVLLALRNGDGITDFPIKLGNGDSLHSADFLDARDKSVSKQGYEILKQIVKNQFLLSGGGLKSWNANTSLFSWNNRFITIGGGTNSTVNSGYFDINMPTSGNALVANNSTTWGTRAFTPTGIVLNPWESLYYVTPIGLNNGSQPLNFRIVPYNQSARIPDNWILIALRNGDKGTNDFLKLGTGEIIQSQGGGWVNLVLPNGVVNYNNGYPPAQYRIEYSPDGNGIVRLRGMLQINTVPANGTNIATFANNIGMSYTSIIYVRQYNTTNNTYDKNIRIDVNGGGLIYYSGTGIISTLATTWLSISDITLAIN